MFMIRWDTNISTFTTSITGTNIPRTIRRVMSLMHITTGTNALLTRIRITPTPIIGMSTERKAGGCCCCTSPRLPPSGGGLREFRADLEKRVLHEILAANDRHA